MYDWSTISDGPWDMDQFNRDAQIFMQFTGLHDKNGKEIWEGDVVRMKTGGGTISKEWGGDGQYHEHFCNFKIEYQDDPHWGFILAPFDPRSKRPFSVHHSEVEVLGNIYENPELVK